jgi:prepilin-type processing-associated H-X9-DG protein
MMNGILWQVCIKALVYPKPMGTGTTYCSLDKYNYVHVFHNNNGYWYNLLQPYAKSTQVFICPSVGTKSSTDTSKAYFSSYGWNIAGTKAGAVGGSTDAKSGEGFGYYPATQYTPGKVVGVPLSVVEQPSATILVTDPTSSGYNTNGLFAIGSVSQQYMPVLHGGQPYSETAVTVTDFSGGGNYLFADGHVKFLQSNIASCSGMWDIEKSNPYHGCSPFKP